MEYPKIHVPKTCRQCDADISTRKYRGLYCSKRCYFLKTRELLDEAVELEFTCNNCSTKISKEQNFAAHWCSYQCLYLDGKSSRAELLKADDKVQEIFKKYHEMKLELLSASSIMHALFDTYFATQGIVSDLGQDFYRSEEWRALRYDAIEKHGRKCMGCGSTPSDGVKIHVDHIKPRSKHPELALDLGNLQILCEACNLGKGNRYDTDWRGGE